MKADVTILEGHAITQMRDMPAESVHLIVTSPPYFGLRDYNIPGCVWGGGEDCRHIWGARGKKVLRGAVGNKSTIDSDQDPKGGRLQSRSTGDFCGKCGAWRGAFGLEPSPAMYVEHSVMIFREAWRVLRKDGTLWLNLGDSFAPTGGDRRDHGNGFNSIVGPTADAAMPRTGRIEQGKHLKAAGLKPGDLMGIPWRVAFALQADGWYLRRDNVWAKKNPMPESVSGWRWEKHRIKVKAGWTKETHPNALGGSDKTRSGAFGSNGGVVQSENAAEYEECPGCDKCNENGGLILRRGNWRCTTAHEYVFQFSKSPNYFCDAEAAREKSTQRASGNKKRFVASKNGERGRINNHLGSSIPYQPNPSGRNLRSVWNIPTQPYRGAHFATFPADLVRPIIKAASPLKCCGLCLAPFAPVVERGEALRAQQRACGGDAQGLYFGEATKDFATNGAQNASAVKARILAGMVEKNVVGWRPTCGCGSSTPPVPGVVLDIFAGSFTTCAVAIEQGRQAIGIEINAKYIELGKQRCNAVTPNLIFV